MASPKTRGCCLKCGRDLQNAAMAKHLAGCVGNGPALHVALDAGPGTWWMHLALAPSATLRDLDQFLRGTWLECCGHMSAFDIGDVRYESHPADLGFFDGPKPKTMGSRASAVLRPGMSFVHEYDFGTTTVLRGRVFGQVEASGAKVVLLARNAEIVWPCEVCGEAAARVCPCCGAMGCAACEAPCDCLGDFADESLPVVNSPRMGLCAYTG